MTTDLALAAQERTLWYIGLGIGAVVVFAVITLLTLLVRFVHDIDVNVFGVWEMAKRLAANTATTWQLNQTAAVLEDLKQEALTHKDLLERKR